MRRLACVLIGSCLVGAPRSTKAVAAAQVRYPAAAECPDGAPFRADVARNVRDESHAAHARLQLRIEAREDVYDGELVAFDSDGNQGSRHVSGKTCAEVAPALAFLAGLVIE